MKGENHNPLFPKIEEYSEEMPPQDRVVFDCKIDLAGLPDETYGVEVLDWQKEPMEEVVGDEPLEEHQFRVDYTHGYLYFHPVHNKKTVTIQKYYSRGMLYFPASRVYSIDEHGRVDINTTLQDYIDSIKSWIFQGDYQAQKFYTANNSVYSDGSVYIAKQDVPANKIPKKNPEYWQPMSSGFLYRGEYDSGETYYPREIVAYKKGYYACLQEVSGSTPGSGIAWQEIVSVDSIYEAWQGTDGNGGLKQEIAETLERVENTRDEIVQEWEGTENSEGLKQQLEDMLNGIVIEDNLTSTSTTSSLSARQGKVLNDTKADKQTEHGGFAGGAGASAEHGGSIGMETKTGDGFAGGYQAKTVDANNNAIDAIQLGTGMNSTEKTLQVYDKQLLDAEGHIPDERMPQLADKQTEWIITTAGTGAAYTATLDPVPESLYIGMQITIIPHVSSSSSSATLNVNDTGAKYFRQRGRTTGTLYSPSVYSFLAAGKPTTLIYDGTYWVMTEYSRPNWNDIKDKPEAILSAENIIAGDNVTVTTNGNDVTISTSGGGSDVNVVDNLTSTSTTSALSANQGRVLKSAVDGKSATSHASTSTTYGVGTASNYGHVKLVNNLTTTTTGSALDARQGKALQDSKLEASNIIAGDNITVTNEGRNVTIAAASGSFDGYTKEETLSETAIDMFESTPDVANVTTPAIAFEYVADRLACLEAYHVIETGYYRGKDNSGGSSYKMTIASNNHPIAIIMIPCENSYYPYTGNVAIWTKSMGTALPISSAGGPGSTTLYFIWDNYSVSWYTKSSFSYMCSSSKDYYYILIGEKAGLYT